MEVNVTAPPTAGNNFDLTGNLTEATAVNTAGQGISLRDQATYNLRDRSSRLGKTSLSGGVPDPGQTVVAGQTVSYQVTLTNTGLEPAQGVEVWDDLPAQVTGTRPTTARRWSTPPLRSLRRRAPRAPGSSGPG